MKLTSHHRPDPKEPMEHMEPEDNSINTSLLAASVTCFQPFLSLIKSKETGVRTPCFCFHCSSKCVCGVSGLLTHGNRCILFYCVLSSRLPAELEPETNKQKSFYSQRPRCLECTRFSVFVALELKDVTGN